MVECPKFDAFLVKVKNLPSHPPGGVGVGQVGAGVTGVGRTGAGGQLDWHGQKAIGPPPEQHKQGVGTVGVGTVGVGTVGVGTVGVGTVGVGRVGIKAGQLTGCTGCTGLEGDGIRAGQLIGAIIGLGRGRQSMQLMTGVGVVNVCRSLSTRSFSPFDCVANDEGGGGGRMHYH